MVSVLFCFFHSREIKSICSFIICPAFVSLPSGIMRPQAAIFLRALGLLLSMASIFCEVTPSHNTTPETTTTMGYNTSANEITSTIMSLQTDTFTMKAHNMTTISTTSTKNPSPTTFMPQSDTKPTTSHSYVGTVVSLFFFFCVLVSLFYIAYVWYVRHGRPSFLEIWRTVAVSARNAWAAVVEHLRPSSKEEEGDEEMEAGEEKKQDDEDNNDDDSSEDYSSIGGSIMMEGPKYDEEEDGKNNERDDMTSIELKDEKTEREKDNFTML